MMNPLLFAIFLLFFIFSHPFLAFSNTTEKIDENKQPAKIKVACIGDSITFGFGLQAREKTAYPAQLAEMLGKDYEVRNFGNSGRGIILSTLRNPREFRAYLLQPEYQQSLDYHPDIVICNLGINDDLVWNEGAHRRAEFIRDYCTLLRAYSEQPQRPKIFIWTHLLPISAPHRSYQSDLTHIAFQMSNDLQIVAESAPAVGLNLFDSLWGIHDLLLKDGLHPSEYGSKKIAESTFKQIRYFLEIPKNRLDLPYYFADKMVFQEKQSVIISGYTTPYTSVSAGFEGISKQTTTSDRYGKFTLRLLPLKTNQNYTLTIQTANAIKTFKEVQFGHCFLVLGQSNIIFRMSQSAHPNPILNEDEKKQIRLLNRIPTLNTPTPWASENLLAFEQQNKAFAGTWQDSSNPQNISSFSAVAFEFAKRYYQQHKKAIGIIVISVGGAPTESFIDRKFLLENPQTQKYFVNNPSLENQFLTDWVKQRIQYDLKLWYQNSKSTTARPYHYFQPSAIFQVAINPLKNYSFEGIIYYQGESNASQNTNPDRPTDMKLNQTLLKLLFAGFRAHFNTPKLPIVLVQLPKMNRPWESYRKLQKEIAQSENLKLCEIYDLGDEKDVHPRNKKEVGERIAELFWESPE